jgi:hypothetical protein
MLQDLEILQILMDIMKRGANPYINMCDGSKIYNPNGMWKQEIKCYKCNENKNGGKLEVPFKDSNNDNKKEEKTLGYHPNIQNH